MRERLEVDAQRDFDLETSHDNEVEAARREIYTQENEKRKVEHRKLQKERSEAEAAETLKRYEYSDHHKAREEAEKARRAAGRPQVEVVWFQCKAWY